MLAQRDVSRPARLFLRGGAIQGGRNDQTRPEEQVSSGELGCLRLYDERFEKLGYLSNFGTSKLIFFGKETTLPLTVRRWIRASKESLSSPIPLCFSVSLPPYPLPLSTPATRVGYSFAASIKFLPQKTAAILNYAHHLLQAQVDPRSTLCNWLFNRQFENEIPNP